jgi:hypothetical protein
MPEIQLEDCLLGQSKGYRDQRRLKTRIPTALPMRPSDALSTPLVGPEFPFILEAGKGLNEHILRSPHPIRGTILLIPQSHLTLQ